MKPTFLFINYGGDFESIAQRIKKEGYPIRYYIATKPAKGSDDTGRGIFTDEERVDTPWKTIRQVDKKDLVILVDDNGQGELCDHLRKDGYKVIGGSALADKIEHERSAGTKLMQDIGLLTPETTNFNSLKDGIKFLEGVAKKDPEAKFVFKPEGEDFAGSAKTYLGKNVEDLIEFISWLTVDCESKHYKLEKFELQEFIEGIEADFGAYFDGEKFMDGSLCLDIEEKKSGDGNKGQATGCMGNVVLFLPNNKYYTQYIEKLTPYLKKVGYVGQVSINNIFSKKNGQPYGLEFTPRFGWDAHLTEAAIHKAAGKTLAEFYLSLVNKQKFEFSHDLIGCGVRVSCNAPGMPREEASGRRFSFKPEIEDDLWFYAVSKKDDFYMVEDNTVLVAHGVAKTYPLAHKRVYEEILPKLFLSDIYYRMEIGQRFPEVVKFLKHHGWL